MVKRLIFTVGIIENYFFRKKSFFGDYLNCSVSFLEGSC